MHLQNIAADVRGHTVLHCWADPVCFAAFAASFSAMALLADHVDPSPEVMTPLGLYEVREAIAGHRVRHNGCPRVLPACSRAHALLQQRVYAAQGPSLSWKHHNTSPQHELVQVADVSNRVSPFS